MYESGCHFGSSHHIVHKQIKNRTLVELFYIVFDLSLTENILIFLSTTLVEVILDPKTAYPALILSEDQKEVHMGEQTQVLFDNPERFRFLPGVLGAEGIDSGTLEWVVEVGKAKEWAVGIARESVERKYSEDITITQGFWVLQLAQGEYQASTSPPIKLTLWKSPQRILIILKHDFDRPIFYNADSMDHIFTFNYPFSEKVFPFVLVRDKETPLKICPRTSV